MIAHIESTESPKREVPAEGLANEESPGTVDRFVPSEVDSNPVSADDVHDEYVPTAKAFGGMRLHDLPRHESALERRRKDALQKNEPRKSPTKPVAAREPLTSLLRPHLSRLQREKLEYDAKSEASTHVPPSKKQEEPTTALEDIFIPHVSLMEKRKNDAALKEKYAPSSRNKGAQKGSETESLDLVQHVCRLEREKTAFQERQSREDPSKPVQRRKSRLQMEKEAIEQLYSEPDQAAG